MSGQLSIRLLQLGWVLASENALYQASGSKVLILSRFLSHFLRVLRLYDEYVV